VDEILALFDKLDLDLISFCPGGLRGTVEEIEPYFQFGDALGVDMLSGTMGREPELVDITAELCNKYGKKYAIEPHGKTSTLCDPNEILAAIERYPDVLGACPDSGWFEKEGFNAVQAFEILKNVTLHTHLKGFKSTTGRACTPGDGDINMDTIVRTLRDTGYDGVWSIEWEAPYDPSDDLARSLKYVKGILAE